MCRLGGQIEGAFDGAGESFLEVGGDDEELQKALKLSRKEAEKHDWGGGGASKNPAVVNELVLNGYREDLVLKAYNLVGGEIGELIMCIDMLKGEENN